MTDGTRPDALSPPRLSWGAPLLFALLTTGAVEMATHLQAAPSWRVAGCALIASVFNLLMALGGGGALGMLAATIAGPADSEKRAQSVAGGVFVCAIMGWLSYMAISGPLQSLMQWRLPYFLGWSAAQALLAGHGTWRWERSGAQTEDRGHGLRHDDAGAWGVFAKAPVTMWCYTAPAFAALQLWQAPQEAALCGSLILLGLGLHLHAHRHLKRIGARENIDLQVHGRPPRLHVTGDSAGQFSIPRHDIAWVQHRRWQHTGQSRESRRTYECLDVLCHDGSVITLQDNSSALAGHVGARAADLAAQMGVEVRSAGQYIDWSESDGYRVTDQRSHGAPVAPSDGLLSIDQQPGQTVLTHRPQLRPIGRSELALAPLSSALVWASIVAAMGVLTPTYVTAELSHQLWLGAQALGVVALTLRIRAQRRRLLAPSRWTLDADGLHRGDASKPVLIAGAEVTGVQVHAKLSTRTASLQVHSQRKRVTLFELQGDLVTTKLASLWAARSALIHQLGGQ